MSTTTLISLTLASLALAGAQERPSFGPPPAQADDLRRPPTQAELDLYHATQATHARVPRAGAAAAARVEERGPSPYPALALAPPDEQVFYEVEDGVHWAMGHTWKASFGPDGATFIPFLGSEAARNYPIRFLLESVRHGAVSASLAAPVVSRDGDRVVLDRGPVRSEYLTAVGGVEQRFVLDAPLGTGDLLLDVAVASDLTAVPEGAGWRFDGPEGGARYGAATVLDARGRSMPLEVAYDGARLRFVVPSAFLAEAVWPVTIDPFLSSTVVDSDIKDQSEADVAYDRITNQYMVVFEEAFSATDGDVKSYYLTSLGALIPTSAVYINFDSQDCRRPRVACTANQRQFLTVFTLNSTPTKIRARARHCDTSAQGVHFFVDNGTASARAHADVAGDTFTGSSAHFVVVWQREWSATDADIVARSVDADGAYVSGEVFVTNLVGIRDEQPSCSNTITPGRDDCNIVWRRFNPTTGLSQILGAAVRFDAGAVSNPLALSGSIPGRYAHPSVSGQSSAALGTSTVPGSIAVWEEDFISDRDVIGVTFGVTSSSTFTYVANKQNISAMEHVDIFLDQGDPTIAVIEDQFVLSYASLFPGASDHVIRETTLNVVFGEFGLSQAHEALDISMRETGHPRVASRWEHGEATSSECVSAYVSSSTTNPTSQRDIRAIRHARSADFVNGIQYELCGSEPNSTGFRSYLRAVASAAIPTSIRLIATRLPDNSNGYFLVSMTPGNGVTPPNNVGTLCLGGSIGRYSSMVLNTGTNGGFSLDTSMLTISQPGGIVVGMPGQTWYFQGWHRDTSGGAATSNFTNAVGVPIP
ncbi:MAG: hypothetical protein R3F49_17315 [Planctomycetota bacterium]